VFRAICIIAAIVTPTVDILNMCLFRRSDDRTLAISIGVAWIVNSTRAHGADSV